MEQPHPLGSHLADTITDYRTTWNVSLRSLADQTGIPHSTLHRRMKTGAFTLTEISLIADTFATTPTALLADAEWRAA